MSDERELDEAGLGLWSRAVDLRSLVLALGGASCFVLPSMEDERTGILALVLGIALPYNMLVARRMRRRRQLDVLVPSVDLILAVAFVWVVPSAWAAIPAVAVADIALSAVMFGRRVAIATSLVGVVALATGGFLIPIDAQPRDLGLSGFGVGAALVIATVGLVAGKEREVRRRYTHLLNGIDGITWEWDIEAGRFAFLSPQIETILGWSMEEANDPATWAARVHPNDQMYAARRMEAAAQDDRTHEFRIRHADGRWVWVRDAMTVEVDAHGVVTAARGLTIDVTAERLADLALRQYADIIENIDLALVVWHLEDLTDASTLEVVRANPDGARLFPYPAEELVGLRMVDLLRFEDARTFSVAIADCIRSGTQRVIPETAIAAGDGEPRYFSSRILPLPGQCAAVFGEDITERRNADETLRHQALHDSLTGLPNRALLSDRLNTALTAAARTGDGVGLLIMDLDQFKEVNDTLGHPVGDRMLEQVGARLATLLRDCDTVARLGGDEFAVLLTVDATRAGAEHVARRVRLALAEPFDLEGVSVQTAASIGIALSPENGTDVGTLVQRADIAMYNAKRSGRGHAFYSAEDDRSSLRRLSLVGELRRAIERDELVLHYQPQLDLLSGTVVGVEALVRWNHPEHGLLPPDEFIGLAEVSGTIQPLTRWVVRNAVARAVTLAGAGTALVMAVNVSARNLYDPGLAVGIGLELERAGLPPSQLLLELTESQLVDDPSQVMLVLTSLSEMGVRIAVDDFGTGWSSLANLTRLPIHQVKIDKSFVSRMLDGGDDAVVVRSIIDLGHNLGLTVVAEGVEQEGTLDALAALGCDQVQGNFVSRPVPAAELEAWLASRRSPAATS